MEEFAEENDPLREKRGFGSLTLFSPSKVQSLCTRTLTLSLSLSARYGHSYMFFCKLVMLHRGGYDRFVTTVCGRRFRSENALQADELSEDSRVSVFSLQVNVFLRITSKRPDGYHDLASLFHVSHFSSPPKSCKFYWQSQRPGLPNIHLSR